jgi:hypothetical protein
VSVAVNQRTGSRRKPRAARRKLSNMFPSPFVTHRRKAGLRS